MKKLMSAVLAAVMVVGLFGTAAASASKSHSKSAVPAAERTMSPDDLKDVKGTMLTVECYIVEWGYSQIYEVYYDGEIYTPFSYCCLEMSDSDLLSIHNFCVNASDGRYDDYSEDVCDGSTYTFTFYDADGKAHVLYSGYCYDNDELMSVMAVLDKYYVDIEYEEWCD